MTSTAFPATATPVGTTADRRSRLIATAAAVFLGLIALAVLAAAVLGIAPARDPLRAHPALAVNGAIGLLLLATGFRAYAVGRTAWLRVAATIALLLGLATLMEYLFDIHLPIDVAPGVLAAGGSDHAGRMSVARAVDLLLGGVGLLALELQVRRIGAAVAGVCGFVLSAVTLGMVLSWGTNLLDGLSSANMIGVPGLTAVVALTIGVALIVLAWRLDWSLPFPAWVSWAVGTSSLITTVFVYAAIKRAESLGIGGASEERALDLANLIVGLGIIVSILLTLTLRLFRQSVAIARAAERTRFASVVESATDGLWEYDLRSGEARYARNLWQLLGYDPEEEPTRTWGSLVHPEDIARAKEAMDAHLAGRADTYEAEYRIKSRSGEWHTMMTRGRIVERDESGHATRVVGIMADTTKRKRAEAALADSERQFRAVFNSGFQFQALLDLDCNLLEANKTSLEFAGVSADSVRGKPYWETPWWAGNPERVARLQRGCARAAVGETVSYQESIHGGGGRHALIDFSLKPVYDDRGGVVQLLAEGRDITKRKQEEDTVREMDALTTIGRVAARVAHEINNPLAGISNAFLLLKDAIPPTHPHYSYVGAIEREIARIATVTRQLYETYRPEREQAKVASVPVVVAEAVRSLEPASRASNVRVEVDTTAAHGSLPIPASLLRQAVTNLVQNAIEASPVGGTVSVRAWREDSWFELSVRDRGPGVPEGLREEIFHPFVSTKPRSAGGLGLGLSLVRRSVQALGGRIEIHDCEGGGAEFVIRLPLATLREGGE